MLFLPELVLLGAGLILFFLSIGKPRPKVLKYTVLTLGLLNVIASLITINLEGSLFYDAYRIDLFSQSFKLIMSLTLLGVIVAGTPLQGIKKDIRAEYYLFLFMSVLGLVMLVSSVELISIFVALELSSFTVYAMVPMRRSDNGPHIQAEAGIKYLLYGVMATGFMLFGMSYMYGLTGSTYLPEITEKLTYMYNQPAALVAIIMVISGFFYKLGLFPFHFWVPDVYEGAANETTTFIATVPKIAAVALLLRLITMIHLDGQAIVNLLMVASIASMFYGNLSALVQTDLKRMLGFSGISHAGFVLFGLLTFQITGYANAFFYIIAYVLMNLACFLVICNVSQQGENVTIDSLKGLHKRSPLLALTLLVGLFSLAGIPPFVGFTGKLFLLLGALKQDYLIPVILAALNTAIAIYYYLSVVRVAYCTDEESPQRISIGFFTTTLAVLLIGAITILGIMPSMILNWATQAIEIIM